MPDPRQRAIATAFGKAAPTYEAHAGLQRHAARGLAALIGDLPLNGSSMLELGCGTGLFTRQLLASRPCLHGVVTDLAPAMVARCRSRTGGPFTYAAADAENPPFAGRHFSLICANLALQWFAAPMPTLARLAALTRPGGWLAFSTLGPESLEDWRGACAAEGLLPATPAFPDPTAIAGAWPGDVRLHREVHAQQCGSGLAFLSGLRGLGATTPRANHVPAGPGRMRRALRRFEAMGAIARYEVVYLLLSTENSGKLFFF
jgi:malonyl-CoA O-methyltransferase